MVDNRPGAGGSIGVGHAARQPPDGQTLLIGKQATHAANTALYRNLRYDPLSDFAPVHGLIETSPVLGVHPGLPARTLKEFVEIAHRQPGAIRYGSAGMGSGGHLVGEQFQQATGVRLTHVPYKGMSQVVADLLGGHVDAAFDPPTTLLQPMLAGQIRPLAYLGQERLATLPDVPTAREAGLPAIEGSTWTVIYTSAGTPPEIVARLADVIAEAMKTPEMRQNTEKFGGRLMQGLRGEPLNAFVRRELVKWQSIVRKSGVTLE
ncbi:MAG: hypothetical protein GAK38_03656 [Xylophilus sp.]|nr:MAG: hypothetical protein GAK38_03656 [Xylophilus sp.]